MNANQVLKSPIMVFSLSSIFILLIIVIMLMTAILGIFSINNSNDGSVTCSQGNFNEAKFRAAFQDAGAFTGMADVFINVATANQIDPVLFAAIAFHETGYGKSSAVRNKNNPGGLMGSNGLMSFPTLEAGIEAMGKTLHNRIINDGLNTIEKLGQVYAPVGAANDPTGLNKNWVPAIEKIASDLGGLTMNCSQNTQFVSDSEALNKVMAEALKYQGQPYVFGGNNPSTGFDCSGLMQWIFGTIGVRLPRTANEQYNASKKIPRDQAKPGDLVFFKGTYNAGVPITHVGIYVGNNQFYNSNGSGIEYSSLSNPYWASHFAGFGRIVDFQ